MPPSPERFSAHLSNVTLFDLIQFECLQRSRRVIRVAEGAREGLLWFRAGNVVHAAHGRETGEAAVRAMLRWSTGTFQECEAPWPAEETIAAPWQSLLLRAAHALDEAGEARKVLSFPVREAPVQGGDDVTRRSEPTARTPRRDGVEAVRLSSRGEVLAGDATLADATAYSAQIADIIAELMGLERFTSLELTLPAGACVVARNEDGGLSSARGGRGVAASVLWDTVQGLS